MGRNTVRFSAANARKLNETARYIDQQPRNKVKDKPPADNFGGALVFKTTTSITALSGSTPGHGSAKMQKYAGIGGAYSDLTSTTFTIVNPQAVTIASGALVTCVIAYGHWTVISVDSCSHTS